MKEKDKYYFKFVPQAKVNYLFIFSLWEIAEFNISSHIYDIIHYDTIKKLATDLGIPITTLRRYLDDDKYNDFFTIDKKKKIIILKNNIKEIKPFVYLTKEQVLLLKQYKNNLLCKYMIYIVYYCRLYEKIGKPQDFTAK